MSEILESSATWRKIERRETIRESRNYLYETIGVYRIWEFINQADAQEA